MQNNALTKLNGQKNKAVRSGTGFHSRFFIIITLNSWAHNTDINTDTTPNDATGAQFDPDSRAENTCAPTS